MLVVWWGVVVALGRDLHGAPVAATLSFCPSPNDISINRTSFDVVFVAFPCRFRLFLVPPTVRTEGRYLALILVGHTWGFDPAVPEIQKLPTSKLLQPTILFT
jgi:hypothetical protein